MEKDFVFRTEKDNIIRTTCYGVEDIKSSPCVVFVHGFKGFKDWGFWPETGKRFSDNGFFVLSFNFSHNGIGGDRNEFTEFDKFALNTLSLEISELNEIIDAYNNNYFGETHNKQIGLLGHSRGGGISLLTAAERNDIKAATVWASIAEFDRYSARQKEKWKKEGVFEVVNSRTNQIMRLNVSLLEDIENNSEGTLNIEKAVKELNIPFLILHGDQDLTVPPEEADQLYEWADKNKTELYKIKSAGHTFDIVHPFQGSNPKFNELLDKTITFFKNNLFEENYAG